MKELLSFKQTGIISGALQSTIERVGKKNLFILSLNLLDWIRVEGMRKRTRNLDLWPGIPWCESLRVLIEQEPIFSQSFKVMKNYLTYNELVTDEERLKTIEYITENDFPPKKLT